MTRPSLILSTILLAACAAGQDRAPQASEHWAYQRPARPTLPKVANGDWTRNAIDYFTLSQLEARDWRPAPQADKRTLIRRLTYTLTGLPPTKEEIAAFLADQSPAAYERLVDRLLDSPRYGERMATPWLDLARYADTHGYHMDAHREMWRWRDWVIDAMNGNMPFDQFTIEQLAGDLLPGPTLSQLIATGFNRNNMVNYENGAIAEEYLAEYAIDRVVTTSTVWLGQTLVCARCHDHKYDPFTQRDFYRLLAFFNNIDEQGIDGAEGNAAPFIAAPLPHQATELARIKQELANLEQQRAARSDQVADRLARWRREVLAGSGETQLMPADAALHLSFDEIREGRIVDAISDEPRDVAGRVTLVPGKHGQSLLCSADTQVELLPMKEASDTLDVALWIYPTTLDRMVVVRNGAAEVSFEAGRLRVRHKEGACQTANIIKLRAWTHVVVTVGPDGVAVYLDGVEQPMAASEATVELKPAESLVLGDDSGAGIRGMVDDLRVYRRRLAGAEAAILAGGDPIRDLLVVEPTERTDEQTRILRTHYLRHHDKVYRRLSARIRDLRSERERIEHDVPTTMVMRERTERRAAHILEQGRYDRPGEVVRPGLPIMFASADTPTDRLGLARWLVGKENPLTSRVVVNRAWQTHFGTGLVVTPEDFGLRGAPPSHPRLLDWLACEFVDSGWNVKHLHRLIVTSATFRQSSRVTPELYERDPTNHWLSRGPRVRLTAEMIRDTVLAVSRLLVEQLGGPGVFPYQPRGLWRELAYEPDEFTAQTYVQSRGRDLYRRGIYTFWKRSVPATSLAAFDAPCRETSTSQRTVSNTAQQALVLMNDTTFVEAARALASDVLRDGREENRLPALAQSFSTMFERATSRQPNEQEASILQRVYQRALARYRAEPTLARQLLKVGESPLDDMVNGPELAAMTAVASVILSMDEAITRN